MLLVHLLRPPHMTQLRGIQDDLQISLKGGDWAEMMADLARQLERPSESALPRGARVWLDAADCPPSGSELEQLVWLLEMHQVKLEWWMGADSSGKRKSAPTSDIALKGNEQFDPAKTEPENERAGVRRQQEQKLWSDAALVSRTLRSGQMVRFEGTVVVFGDVNPGAVVIADGNVFVWGRLRGMVHAGAAGDDSTVVGALELAPSQLRIGGLIARTPDVNKEPALGAELARVRNGRIVIENWDDGKV